MKQKTRKSLSKRIRITKNKKLVSRPRNQNHFCAKKTGQKIRNRRGLRNMSVSNQELIERALKF